jgi:SAM-dependent methyltransferase
MGIVSNIRLYGYLLLTMIRGNKPRNYTGQWEGYWGKVDRTGPGGQVLWDALPDKAAAEDLQRFKPQMNPALPILDLGCGNGRQSRFLAQHFDRVIGVDIAEAAVELARRESEGIDNVEYRTLDATRPGAARALHEELGDVNVYMRAVLHQIQKPDRRRFIDSIAIILGQSGVMYLHELVSEPLDYFRQFPGDSPSGLPKPLHEVVKQGIRPIGFQPDEIPTAFPDERWEILARGEGVQVNTIELDNDRHGSVPAHFMVAKIRAGET